MSMRLRHRLSPRQLKLRVRPRLWPLLQTAGAAVIAWYLARLVVDDPTPAFASIAAVICVGAGYGERPLRAVELMVGVVVGLSVADVVVQAIGTGPAQVGATVLAAMLVAVVLGGGALLVSEAGVSAVLLTSTSSTAPLFPARPVEAVIGAGVGLVVTSLAFPPNPGLHTARATNSVLAELGAVLEDIAVALETRDLRRAGEGLQGARALDADLAALGRELDVARDTVQLSPLRRRARRDLHRYAGAAPHIGFAVLNTRVLARHGCRAVRRGATTPDELVQAVRAVRTATLDLAGELDRPERDSGVHVHAASAARHARDGYDRAPALERAEVATQVRSVAVDLLRAADAAREDGSGRPEPEDVLDLPGEP
jgi:hypothetical protein